VALVALESGQGSMIAGVAQPGSRHQDRIIGAIEQVVGTAGLESLDAIAVTRGPGSHTGLRVGLATAEGLAFARRLRLYPLSSLAVAAHRARLDAGLVLALVPAGRGRVYAQRFECDGRDRHPASLPEVSRVADFTGDLMVSAEPAVLDAATGEGLSPAPQAPGDEALATACVNAASAGEGVAYHEIRGEYGEQVMEKLP
jgi:tRNA threonylcarbamoyladenosine biosynthesis protein TsaB